MSQEYPLVHVVVVDHDGGDLTLACLRSLVASDWPPDRLRIVLVDNGSSAPVLDAVAAELPTVCCLASPTNLGFAGGVNLGLAERGDAPYIALVNNDVTVTPGWLGPLVETLAADPRVGAACPKILLADPAVEITLSSPTHRRGRGDRRDLGVRLSGARCGGDDVWHRVQLVEGFWGYEPMPDTEAGGQWTGAAAMLRVPCPPGGATPTIELRLAADTRLSATATSGTLTTRLDIGPRPAWYAVATDAVPVEVINNVGTMVGADCYASDRGWLEPDHGQYDEPTDVDAWCGAAVLLSRAYVDAVGPLDDRLFLYYEDVEHSLRGAHCGWRYRTVPTSVVRHVHSATSIDGSPLSFHYKERNRLLVAARRLGGTGASRVFARYLVTTGSYALRDIVAPILRGDAPRPQVVGQRVRAGVAAVRMTSRERRGR